MPTRRAHTVWTGTLEQGSGQVELSSSGVGTYEVSFPKRAADDAGGATSPEELIAAAHSACLAMNLSGVLGREGLTADSIDVSAEVTLSVTGGGAEISGIEITLRAAVPGLEADRFAELAATAERTCPVSKALAGTKITMDAALA
jgi:lipoyl-dependent peroxiredoxin